MLRITVTGTPSKTLNMDDDTAEVLAESISRVLGNTIGYGLASPMPSDHIGSITVVRTD